MRLASRSTERGRFRSGGLAYQPARRRRRRPTRASAWVGSKIDLGVRAINTFLTCCNAASAWGSSPAPASASRCCCRCWHAITASDVNVIGLIGERGREVQEWLEDDLGPEGLARSLVVVATSDEPPLMRRQAAHLTMSPQQNTSATGAATCSA